MSMNDERPGAAAGMVRDRIDAALGLVEPPAAPVGAVISRGRRIRLRRRVAGAVAFAVAVAAAVTVPSLAHLPGHRATPVTRPTTPPKVTITPIGPHAPRDLIAAGTINGRPWTIRIGPGPTLTANGMSVLNVGPANNASYTANVVQPWITDGTSGKSTYSVAGAVAPQVTRLGVDLSDGQKLALVPVAHAVRPHGKVTLWAGVVLPKQVSVTRVVAYSRHGVLAYAIPFTGAGVLPSIQNWLRPGQRVPGRTTVTLASGRTGSRRWSISVHGGPWGWCVVGDWGVPGNFDSGCLPSLSGKPGFVFGAGWLYVATARPGVSYLMLALADGRSMRVPVHDVAGTPVFAIGALGSLHIRHWAAYDAAGRRLYGGTGRPGWR